MVMYNFFFFFHLFIYLHKMTISSEKSAEVHGPAYFYSNLNIILNAKSVILMNR